MPILTLYSSDSQLWLHIGITQGAFKNPKAQATPQTNNTSASKALNISVFKALPVIPTRS